MKTGRIKHNNLTRNQENFVQELLKGYNQSQAMLNAYPTRKTWKPASIAAAASAMFANKKIKARYNELIERARENETKKTLWTREQAVKYLRYTAEVNKKDIERRESGFTDELEMLLELAKKHPKNSAFYISEALNNRKTPRATTVNNKGIIDAVAELNKMFGFNEENINMNNAVVFKGEDELED